MARRNRRPKVVWLPQTNAFTIDDEDNGSTISTAVHDVTGAAGAKVDSLHGVVIDGEGQDPLAAANTLADIEDSTYRLRRIVGKIWCGVRQEQADSPALVCASAGFIILRVRPETSTPLDSADHYSVDNIRNGGDPWIWRRSWLLTNEDSSVDTSQFTTPGISNNTIGGNSDGPHVDQKTARIVGTEERLFLVLTTTVLIGDSLSQNAANVRWFWNLRVLASMRTGQGNRRNASR